MGSKQLGFIALGAMLFLGLSCGGGGQVAGGGTGGTGMTVGTITGFGSIYVNGVRYDTTDATVIVNGVEQQNQSPLSPLKVGMVVTVDKANGTATAIKKVEHRRKLYGPPTSVDGPANSVIILGQTVTTNAATVLTSSTGVSLSSVAEFATDQMLEVSGYDQENGVLATRIAETGVVYANDVVEIRGVVCGLNLDARTFTIGGLTVDYASADAALTEGQLVKVTGEVSADKRTLSEAVVTVEAPLIAGRPGQELEMEGVIAAVVAQPDGSWLLTIEGVRVRVTSQTDLDDGLTRDGLTVGRLVEIEGEFEAAGVLRADEIEPRFRESTVEITAPIADITGEGFTILGIPVTVTPLTVVDAPKRAEFLDGLKEGNWLEVKAYRDAATGGLVAVKIEPDSGGLAVELEGAVDANSIDEANRTFTIGGITVNWSATKEASLPTPWAVQSGDELEVTGMATGVGVVNATRIEYDD